MIMLALLLVLLPGEPAIPQTEAQESVPSLDLLEYIGGMEQTSEGELLDPLDIPAPAQKPEPDKPLSDDTEKAFPES